ncbi:MAG: hypothetical protein AAF436_09725 [Myxococcota bacterium]
MKQAVLIMALALGLGCGDDSVTGGGQAELSFTVDEAVRVNFRDELTGDIVGQVYRAEDLDFVGGSVVSAPDASAAVADVLVLDADFREVDTLEAAALVENLPPGEYSFLGALDVDGNGNDLGDPVTFSMQRSFVIEDAETVPFEVIFNGIQPF